MVAIYQLANVYALLAALALVCCVFTSSPKVTRNYLAVVALADLGHCWATYQGLGYARTIDIANWNDMTWGNYGASLFLFVNRVGYLLGLFGSGNARSGKGKKA